MYSDTERMSTKKIYDAVSIRPVMLSHFKHELNLKAIEAGFRATKLHTLEADFWKGRTTMIGCFS